MLQKNGRTGPKSALLLQGTGIPHNIEIEVNFRATSCRQVYTRSIWFCVIVIYIYIYIYILCTCVYEVIMKTDKAVCVLSWAQRPHWMTGMVVLVLCIYIHTQNLCMYVYEVIMKGSGTAVCVLIWVHRREWPHGERRAHSFFIQRLLCNFKLSPKYVYENVLFDVYMYVTGTHTYMYT
jgi:hypothetical protein